MENWIIAHLDNWLNQVYRTGEDEDFRRRTRNAILSHLEIDSSDIGEDWHTVARHAGIVDLYAI